MKLFLVCLAVCLYGVAPSVFAQVYRCVVNDKVIISTEPCPAGATKVTEIKPEPGAAAREAAAKKAADEELARMKAQVELMERARQEREAAFEAARREEEFRSSQVAPAPEPVREEGIVERTVILPVAPQHYPNRYPNQHPNHYPDTRPDAGRPPPAGDRPGRDREEEPRAVLRPVQSSGVKQDTTISSEEARPASKPKTAPGTGKRGR